MRSIFKYIGLAVLLVASGAVGAGVYAWIDDGATVESIPVQVDEPLLTETQANLLVMTHIRASGMWSVCNGSSRRSEFASYVGDGHWFVGFRLCFFTLEDKTGKVIGP